MTKREIYRISHNQMVKLRARLPVDFYLHQCATLGDRVWAVAPVRKGQYVISLDGDLNAHRVERQMQASHSNGAMIALFDSHLMMTAGGRPKTGSTEIMSGESKEWQKWSSIDKPIAGHQAVHVGSYVYLTGGYDDNVRLI